MNLVVKFLILFYFASTVRMFADAAKGFNGAKKRQSYDYQPEYRLNTANRLPPRPQAQPPQQTYEEHEVDTSKGYSAGSGLRSIAQGSANQAHTAVSNQHAAAKQAAYIAKSTLAQSAIQSAATAQAALAGKEVLLQMLEQQTVEAHRALDAAISQLQQSKRAAKAAQQTAQAAYTHVSLLTSSLNSAKAVADHADHSANEAAQALAAQTSAVGQAKANLESVGEQVKSARVDYAATKEAAIKASSSASEAQANAAKAASHATLELHGAVNPDQKDEYDSDFPLEADIHEGLQHDSLDEH